MTEFHLPAERTTRLEQLGIPDEVPLRSSVERGVLQRMSCTAFDPPCFPGVVQWAYTVRALREQFVPLRWQADDAGNFSTVISPDGLVAIAVATGDDRTGKKGLPVPSTKYPKGPVVLSAVEKNFQLSLLDPMPIVTDEDRVARRATWFLLVRTLRKEKEVRFELSLPNEIGDDNRVKSWADRILFQPVEIHYDLPGDDDPPIPDIDVPVDRI